MKIKNLCCLTLCMVFLAFSIPANASVVFFTDFSGGAPTEFSGVTNTESVQGYAGLGTGTNLFADNFLRNTSTGNPASKSILSLTGLPIHANIDLNFLLAIVDSWDGNTQPSALAPDYFNVTVDGITIFSETFDNFDIGDQSYIPSPGVKLAFGGNLGFNNGWPDAAYDMGLDVGFKNIPHSSSTLTVNWFASGGGWQGGIDESWAIDNLEVSTNPIPIPGGVWLLGSGLISLLGFRRKFRK